MNMKMPSLVEADLMTRTTWIEHSNSTGPLIKKKVAASQTLMMYHNLYV
jgi:hypothetical protein